MIQSLTVQWKRNTRSLTVPPAQSSSRPRMSTGSTPPVPSCATDGMRFFAESYAQVATSVTHSVSRKSCGLKPGVVGSKKSVTRTVRFQAGELAIVSIKAQLAGVSLNSYLRASALGSDYQQPIHPELQKVLLATNRELTAQGNNLNQIAKHLHIGQITPDRAISVLDSIRGPLVRTLLAVKKVLAQGAAPY